MPTNSSAPVPGKKHKRRSNAGGYAAKVIVFVMVTFTAVALNMVTYTDFTAIKDDLWLNSHGVLARNGYLHIHSAIHIESSLCAYYDTQEGKAYSKCIELWFPLVLIDENSPEVIHYNPASPEHISTSWGRQVLFSRICMFLLALLLSIGIDFAVFFSVFEVVTGTDFIPEEPPSPNSSTSARPAGQGAAATEANSSLQADATELSEILSQIVSGLQSQTGPNAPYAQAIATELTPLIEQYNRALQSHSREEASRALDEVAACMNDFKADKKKRKLHFGFRHWQNMRKYNSLTDIFRETRYRGAIL